MSYPLFGNNIDFGFLPSGVNADIQVFTAPVNILAAIIEPFQWVKPRGVKMIMAMLISGGSGGGGGLTGASTTARGGGGGGACATMAMHIFPAFVLPDILKVTVGRGGFGGTSGNSGETGTGSFISTGVGLTAANVRPNSIMSSGASFGAGQPGTNSGNAAGGVQASTPTKAEQGWAQAYSVSTFGAGLPGATGGAATGAVGTDITAVWNTISLSGGAGGAGVNGVGTGFAGGAITLQAAMDLPDGAHSPAASYIAGGSAGSGAAVGGPGRPGVQCFKPLIMTGGSGGGSADGQVGGEGGAGGIGCGGGGGGGGTTGGRGGRGGNGLVIIMSW